MIRTLALIVRRPDVSRAAFRALCEVQRSYFRREHIALNSVALLIVLVAAVIHATWNLLAKKAAGGSLFVWLFTTLSSLFLVPAAIVLVIVQQSEITMVKSGFVIGTALLHLVYFLLLQRGYQVGDLSLVYPIARGSMPRIFKNCPP